VSGSCDALSCPDLGTCTLEPVADGCVRKCAFDQPYAIASNADVARLAALGCTLIDGSVQVVQGDADSLVGLESVSEITGSLTIDGAKLSDLRGLDGLASVHTLTVERLDIQSIELPALSHVGQFTATLLPMLQVLSLPALETADTGVMITACSVLPRFDLRALQTVGNELNVSLNDALLTLGGLPALTSAVSLRMVDNPMLPQCEVDAIAARLGSGTHCTCSANDTNATCP
jgi:hypothetical protein